MKYSILDYIMDCNDSVWLFVSATSPIKLFTYLFIYEDMKKSKSVWVKKYLNKLTFDWSVINVFDCEMRRDIGSFDIKDWNDICNWWIPWMSNTYYKKREFILEHLLKANIPLNCIQRIWDKNHRLLKKRYYTAQAESIIKVVELVIEKYNLSITKNNVLDSKLQETHQE